MRKLGRLDVLVNNAAFQEHAESLSDIADQRLDQTLRTNVGGYFFMVRAAIARNAVARVHAWDRRNELPRHAGGNRAVEVL